MLRTIGKWLVIFVIWLAGVAVMLLLIAWLVWPGHAWVSLTGSPWWVSLRNIFTPTTALSQGFGNSIPSDGFEIGSCDPFDSQTGYPLSKERSLNQGWCVYQDTSSQGQNLPTDEPTLEPEAVASSTTGACAKTHDGLVRNSDGSISSTTEWLHIQLWAPGHPEYETILEPGTYVKRADVAGWVWYYDAACTYDEVMLELTGSVDRRQSEGKNNGGYKDPSFFFAEGWLSQ